MPTNESLDENVIRERVAKRLRRIKRLIAHLVLTVVVAIGLPVAVEQFSLPREVEAVIPLAVLLFMGHAFWLLYAEAHDRILQQEIDREQQRRAARAEAVKAKRSQHFSLSDDGELVEVDDSTEYEKAKRHDA